MSKKIDITGLSEGQIKQLEKKLALLKQQKQKEAALKRDIEEKDRLANIKNTAEYKKLHDECKKLKQEISDAEETIEVNTNIRFSFSLESFLDDEYDNDYYFDDGENAKTYLPALEIKARCVADCLDALPNSVKYNIEEIVLMTQEDGVYLSPKNGHEGLDRIYKKMNSLNSKINKFNRKIGSSKIPLSVIEN